MKLASLTGAVALALLGMLPSLTQAQPPRPPVPAPPAPVPPVVHPPAHVRIVDFGPRLSRFAPQEVRVHRGQWVVWTSYSRHPHTVTGQPPFHGSPPWGSGILHRGQSYRHRFIHRGVYRYHCRIHPAMRGEVIVRP